jgi:hypothetical protein
MRNIFGPKRSDDGNWRIKSNQEMNELIEGQNIIGFIKIQRLSWLGHIERMANDDNVKSSRGGNPCQKDLLDDLKHLGRC